MKTLIIKSINDSTQLYEEILDSLNGFNSQSFSINLQNGKIICEIHNNEESYIDFLSHKISLHIVENIQPRIVREEILLEFSGYLDESVNALIKKITWKLLYKQPDSTQNHILNIKSQIKNCITEDNSFNLDGFINFRLKERKKEIQEYITYELNKVLDEEEFDSFISLLKQYISIKIPKNDLIHLIMISHDEFEFMTSDHKKINIDEIENAYNEFKNQPEHTVEARDFIIGVIMTLAPKNLIIHTNHKQDPEIPYILNRIYGTRSTECYGCEFCEKIKSLKNINKDKK